MRHVPRPLCTLLLLLMAALLPACSMAYKLDDEIVIQARQAADMANLRLGHLSSGTWVVAQLNIQRQVGVVPGEYIDETGQMHTPPGAHLEIQKSGTCTVVELVHGELRDHEWQFSWNEPLPMGLSGGRSLRAEIPLLRSGLYLAQVAPEKKGREQFPTLLALPADWQAFPKLALQTDTAYRATLGDGTGLQPGMLEHFFDDPNPLVQLNAWHVLAIADGPARLGDRLSHATGTRQAAMMILLAQTLTAQDQKLLVESIHQTLAAKKRPEEVLGLAVGAWQVTPFSRDALTFAQAILRMIPSDLDRGLSQAAQELARVREFSRYD